MEAAHIHCSELGTASACQAFGVPRASIYRHRKRGVESSASPWPRRSHRALNEAERQAVLGLLHGDRFVDQAPAQVAAALLDQGR